LIDSAIRGVEPKTDWLKTAPTTAAVCHELDATAKQPDRVTKLPLEVFTQFDPTADKFALQKAQGHIIQFNPATAKALLDAGARLVDDATLISDDEKTQLLQIQGKMDKLKTELSKSSTAAASTEFFNQSTRRVVETIQSGALPEKNIRTMDSIHAEYATNRRALNEVLLDLFHEAFPLAIKARSKALEIIRAQQAFLENKEREEAKAFALPWAPSFLWKACATIQARIHPDRLRLSASSDSAATPRDLFEGIFEL
jgi:hypothetical protein